MTRLDIPCIACGGQATTIRHQDGPWRVLQCSRCGLGVLDPRPDPGELACLYDQDYFEGHYAPEMTPVTEALARRLKQESHRVTFVGSLKKTGKLLDVGCGRGYFLLACRNQGYEVEGFDVSAAAAGHIRDAFGIRVHVGDMQTVNPGDERFDVITMWHSLEHTSDPDAAIAAACRWLKADGILVIDVPNIEGYDARHYQSLWAHWDLPYHHYHYTPRSLALLLDRHDLDIVRKKTYLSNYVKEKLEASAIPAGVARVIAQCFTGGSYAVIARKRMK